MIDECLSTGFGDADSAKNHDAYVSCLDLLDSLPYFSEYKRRSYELLQLRHGMTVLESGCGLGDDAFRIAERVMPGGKVVALDSSVLMIEKARGKLESVRPPEPRTGATASAKRLTTNLYRSLFADGYLFQQFKNGTEAFVPLPERQPVKRVAIALRWNEHLSIRR